MLDGAGLARIPDAPLLANGVLRLHAAIVRDMAIYGDGAAGAAERWGEVFPGNRTRRLRLKKTFRAAP